MASQPVIKHLMSHQVHLSWITLHVLIHSDTTVHWETFFLVSCYQHIDLSHFHQEIHRKKAINLNA